jgi:hypothetical protein
VIGLRIGEALALRKRDVDLSRYPALLYVVTEKTNKRQVVFLPEDSLYPTPRALSFRKEEPAGDGTLFPATGLPLESAPMRALLMPAFACLEEGPRSAAQTGLSHQKAHVISLSCAG